LKNVDTAGLRGYIRATFPEAEVICVKGSMRGDSLWEIIYHQRKEYGAKDAALRNIVF